MGQQLFFLDFDTDFKGFSYPENISVSSILKTKEILTFRIETMLQFKLLLVHSVVVLTAGLLINYEFGHGVCV